MSYRVWGWGEPHEEPTRAALAELAPLVSTQLGFPLQAPETGAPLDALPAPRVAGDPALPFLVDPGPVERARHSIGRSYRDLIRGLRGFTQDPPPVVDLVATPPDEAAIRDLYDWAAGAQVAVIPYGGGTSVVGGVEPEVGGSYRAVVSLDLRALSGVPEIDLVSRAARVLAGTRGPDLDAALAPHDLSARFYPQSYERSTVGGWVATRAAGHYATRLQHIDDLVESIRAVTPAGIWQSRRLPGSGAGPSPDRWLLGSEGTLGTISEVWLRLQRRPATRAKSVLAAADFAAGARAVRALTQSGAPPATVRLIEGPEAALSGTLGTGETALLLGSEGADETAVRAELAAAVECCRDAGLRTVEQGSGAGWRNSFLRAPYLRDSLVCLGVLVETFETAVTWERLPGLVDSVGEAVRAALGPAGRVTCRLTHAYPDGAAPYFTVLAPARRGSELAQWQEVKDAATEAVLAAGGTVTHHHAVGRDHRTGYDAQRPEPFALAFGAAKAALDPAGVCNPGVLLAARTGPFSGEPAAGVTRLP